MVTKKTLKNQEFRKSHPNYDKEWREKNRVKLREQQKNFYQRHIEKQRKRSLIKNRKSRKDNPELWTKYDKKYYMTPKTKFNIYKKNAKNRQIKFEITFEYFIEFWTKPCSYCGSEIQTIGIDRVDNKIGYIVGNLKSCCAWCNRMKMDHSEKDFLSQCKRIAEYEQWKTWGKLKQTKKTIGVKCKYYY